MSYPQQPDFSEQSGSAEGRSRYLYPAGSKSGNSLNPDPAGAPSHYNQQVTNPASPDEYTRGSGLYSYYGRGEMSKQGPSWPLWTGWLSIVFPAIIMIASLVMMLAKDVETLFSSISLLFSLLPLSTLGIILGVITQAKAPERSKGKTLGVIGIILGFLSFFCSFALPIFYTLSRLG